MTTSEIDYFSEIEDEEDLYEPIRILLKKKYEPAQVEITDKKNERKHGCDLIVDRDGFKIGVQVKTTEFTRSTYTNGFSRTAWRASRYVFPDGQGGRIRFAKFIWITTKNITETISDQEFDDIAERFSNGVERWNGKRLRDEFLDHYPSAFTNIKIHYLHSKAEVQSTNGNHIFAAHYLFRVFILQLLQADVSAAKGVIQNCISHIDQQTNKSIYFYRSLKRFYEIWKDVAESDVFDGLVTRYRESILPEYKQQVDEYEKTWYEYSFLIQMVHDDAIKKHLESRGLESSDCDYNFLCDFQYIFAQLQILFHVYADSPAGLSSRQVCRTLLRFGFPPIEKLAQRISRMKDEAAAEEHRSVDGECSLCTGIVLSCFVLANEESEKSRPLKLWLESLDFCRYSYKQKEGYLDPSDANTALHYAAPVLEAFVDCGDAENSRRILEHFFVSKAIGKDFYDGWMMYRNISSLEVCAYIFSAFHRYLLSSSNDFRFTHRQSQLVRRALTNLVNALNKEATPNSRTARLYATRENIQSFCVGLLIGEKEPILGLLTELVQNFHRRARGIKNNKSGSLLKKRSLLDSNVDRTTRFIEGWVAYWETIFFLLNDAPEFGPDGARLRKTIGELKAEGYLPNYN